MKLIALALVVLVCSCASVKEEQKLNVDEMSTEAISGLACVYYDLAYGECVYFEE